MTKTRRILICLVLVSIYHYLSFRSSFLSRSVLHYYRHTFVLAVKAFIIFSKSEKNKNKYCNKHDVLKTIQILYLIRPPVRESHMGTVQEYYA